MPTPLAAALADADLCVKCGLCLPHCPTYRLSAHEADGPRGRIALAQGLLTGAVTASPVLAAHLDGCLSCRACEAVCPAKVPYGRVLDTARATLATPPRTRLTRAMAVVLDSPSLRALVRLALWLWSRLREHAGRRVLRGPRWLAYRPVVRRLRGVSAPAQASVALFTGCVSDIAEREVLQDAVRLFAAAGVMVAIPPAQGCCGALQQHGGLPLPAATSARRNALAFAACDTVLPLTTGCGAALRDLGTAASDAPALAPKVRDLCATLATALDAHPPVFKPLGLRVGIHTACTQAHVFGARTAIRQLLARIPGIDLVDLAPESGCCGAAGTAFITHPGQADQLLQPKLDAARHVDVVVSANIGCSLHWLAGLRREGRAVPVLHPVSLLAQALGH